MYRAVRILRQIVRDINTVIKEMKESTEKKITTLKVFKDYNYAYLASSTAAYCATIAMYEEQKKAVFEQ